MALELFPRELTRKPYGLRLVGLLGFVAVGLFLFLAALISGYVYLGWVVAAWIYGGFGLAVPRLRNAGKPTWCAVFFFIPRLNIIAAIVLLIIRERTPESDEASLKVTRDHMRERLRSGESERAAQTTVREEII